MPDPTTAPSSSVRRPPLPWRALTAFGRFWWDFLIGDTPELTVAIIVVVGVIAVLAQLVSTTAAWITLPVLVVIAFAASVRRGRRP